MGGKGYRPDIDGLRAVSIVSVVAYHVGLPFVPGGFVGVDVFFVISGFLITHLLLKEIRERGSIDLLAFYARRARRLLPAFFVIIAVTLLLGFVLLLPLDHEQSRLARSGIYAAFYASNFHFARLHQGYFDAPAQSYPLVHTWSLSVEEQFYLVWPAILILTARLSRGAWDRVRQHVPWLLLAIFAGSLSYSTWASMGAGKVAQAGFYLATSRAWELAIGALLAVAEPALCRQALPRAGTAAAIIGLGGILAAALTYGDGMPYPGLPALLPTIGAAVVIGGGLLAPRGWVARLLSATPAVALGRVSYSWYLWHWPLLAFVRANSLDHGSLLRDGAVALFALGLAWVTFQFIEDPIRRRRLGAGWSSQRTLAAAVAGTVVVCAVAFCLMEWERVLALQPGGGYDSLQAAVHDRNPRRSSCHYEMDEVQFAPRQACTFAQGQGHETEVVVWGDSHADHLVPMVEAAAASVGLGVVQRTMSSCPPYLGGLPYNSGQDMSRCVAFNMSVFDDLAKEPGRISGVVLSARWGSWHRRPAFWDNEGGGGQAYKIRPPDGRATLSTLESRLRATVQAITALGLKVAVVAPSPELRSPAPWCLARRNIEACATPRIVWEAHQADLMAGMRRVVDGIPGARIVDPLPALCGEITCPPVRDGIILYKDEHHLTATGARSLAPWFADTMRWLGTPIAKDQTFDASNLAARGAK